jgi:two-component system, sporulation sensor kinase E
MKKPTILIVDDEEVNVEVLEEMLLEDYTILKAYNGTNALLQAEISSPDLILLDIMMPDINGYEVCKKIKANEKIKHIPVVIVTVLSEREDRIKAIEAGADDFLNKPVDEYELAARARSLIKGKQYYDALMNEQDKLLKFKAGLDNMEDCIIITNVSGDIEYVNPAFVETFGYLPEEISGKHISLIQDPKSLLAIDKESLLQDPKNKWNGKLLGINKNGLRLNMGMKCSPIKKGTHKINLIFVLSSQH